MTNEITPQKEETQERESTETPLLDLFNTAVKKLIRSAKKRGYATHDQINALLFSEEVNSEQIEDILAKLSEFGVNVVEAKEAELEEDAKETETREEPEEEVEGEKDNVQNLSHFQD